PASRVREFAERIGRHLGLPARSVDPEDADAHFGFLGRLVGRDNPIPGDVAPSASWRDARALCPANAALPEP
ncbi:hypothetical protein L1885_24950, partial [Streptomyces fuscigenes]|nr:hypothetical protein [Streptomyces fuscigenes]